ncbi:DUF3828 domain-containing protein [Ornithobacterium rhinotracheale]|uniref:DUF3828 domain-containing protein n=1 Tax=Ornithobacterium rhinotracheale TaxID=28251 RepID=A0A410JRJ1_ORNRH|nr:DUF3828 domain-containing protein [Ornithobacterium rhinotracheale]QAR30782.1 DUF3828 domain-containing protein [Ornithobacterium rhinotracheale]
MRKTILIIILFVFVGCKQNAKSPNEEMKNEITTKEENDLSNKIHFLKDFYYSVYGSDESKENLKKKYVSKRVLNRIDSLTSAENHFVLDYDPFIKGQDYNGTSIKRTLEITPLNNKNKFRVSFLLFGIQNEEKTTIDIILQENTKGKYLINGILNDKYLSFKNTSKPKQKKIYVLDSIHIQTPSDTYSLYVLEHSENKKPQNTPHHANPIILYKNGMIQFENKHLIFPYDENCPADGFQKLVSKKNYFTIEQTYCKDFLIVSSYTTFKISTKTDRIYLYKYGEEYTDRSNPDRDIPARIKTIEDFGTINFEDVTTSSLLKLLE